MPTKKKKTVKKSHRKKVVHKKPAAHHRPQVSSKVTASQLKSELRKRLEDQLGKRYVQRDKSTTWTAHKKMSKKITEIKRELNKLS